jgi:hypothetical protein
MIHATFGLKQKLHLVLLSRHLCPDFHKTF